MLRNGVAINNNKKGKSTSNDMKVLKMLQSNIWVKFGQLRLLK